MKIHPLFKRVVMGDGLPAREMWERAGEPVVEEEGKTVNSDVMAHIYQGQLHMVSKIERLEMENFQKDAKIRELEEHLEGAIEHGTRSYDQALCKIKELEAKLENPGHPVRLQMEYEKGWNAALEEAAKVLTTPRSFPYLNDMVNEIRGLKK